MYTAGMTGYINCWLKTRKRVPGFIFAAQGMFMRLLTGVLLVLLTGVTACRTAHVRPAPAAVASLLSHLSYTALSQDAPAPSTCYFLDNERFVYQVNCRYDQPAADENSFQGSYHDNGDTIFLAYDNRQLPAHYCPYFVKDVSGKYLFQYFTNSAARIVLYIDQRRAVF